ncbi:MAG: GGDEF domain-containing protein [Mycobacteriales bacterium]
MRARPWTGRPPAVWSLAMLYVFAGASLAGGALAPMSARAPVHLDEGLSATCLVTAASIYLAGRRLPRWCLAVLLVFAEALASLLVAHSHSAAGAILVGMHYPWLACYAALFLGPYITAAAVLLGSLGFATGLVFSGLPHLAAAWGGVTLSSAGIAAVLARLTETLRRQTETDPLTRVANRAGLERAALREIARVARRGDPLAVAVLDIDGLKGVNDVFGHAAGDALLRRAVAEWGVRLRGEDVLARIGGDEFVILLPDTDAAGAQDLVRRLAEAGEVPFCAGVAQWLAAETLGALLARADSAMYARKRHRPVEPPLAIPDPRAGENGSSSTARTATLSG